MIIGDAGTWLNRFRGYDEQLLPRIANLLKECVALLGYKAHEDAITVNLVERLIKDPVVRRTFHDIEHHFEPTRVDADGVVESLGSIDLVAHLQRDHKTYLAYECKRLNVKKDSSTKSLATPYVKEGVFRFVTEQYAENLPTGCMLGYVLDGNTATANTKVRTALAAHAEFVNLIEDFADLPELPDAIRFSSRHHRSRSGSQIELRHALLACC